MNFKTFCESHDLLDAYYHQLDAYLRSTRGWRIAPITSDVQDGVISQGQYNIIDNTGATLGRDRLIGKIKRDHDTASGTFVLEHISAAFDETGTKRIKGLGIMNTVYPFDVKFMKQHHVKRVVVEPVNTLTKQKFMKYFLPSEFDVKTTPSAWVATLKETSYQ